LLVKSSKKLGIIRIDISAEKRSDWLAATNASLNVVNPYKPMKTQKKNTQRFALALIVLALTLITGVAKADTITTFDISGNFTGPSPGGTFGGTLVVDVTNGTLSSVDITFPGLADFNSVTASLAFNGGWRLNADNSTSDVLFLDFTTTMPSSLVGFSGGTITDGFVSSPPPLEDLFNGFSGTIARATVPDTGTTLSFLGLSLTGLAFLRRKLC
jgi:hypothetical protein